MNSREADGWMPWDHRAPLRILFLLLFTCVVASMVTPERYLQELINSHEWTRAISKFFRWAAPGVQIHHLVSFAGVGFVAHIGWPKLRAWHVALGLYVVAGFTELTQVWVPGRLSSVWHVLLDVTGGLTGFLIAWLMTYAWGDRTLPGHTPPTPADPA